MKKIGKLLGVFTLATLILVGCGKAEKKSEKQTEVEQKITVSSPTPLSTLDTTQTMDKNTFTIVQHLFEGLYRFDDESQPIPALAEKLEVSKDGKDYTFTLRKDIQWSDGSVITSKDFAFAWKRLVNPETQGPNAYLLDSVKNSLEIRQGKLSIDKIGLETPNDTTFIVHLNQAQPSFLSVISIGWLAPQKEEYVTKLGKEYAKSSENILYSGPFTLKDWTQDSDTWTLVKNEHYYDKNAVKLKEIKWNTIKDEHTGIDLFTTKKLDLAKVSGQYVEQYKLTDGFTSQQDVSDVFIDFNKKEGTPLANVHLRKAIALAINKTTLETTILNDGSKALNGFIPQYLYQNPETKEDFRKYSGEYMKYDLEEAQKEWKTAQKELGNVPALSLLVYDDENAKKVGEFVQAQLQENLEGLKIEIQAQPKNNALQARKEKKYELSISGWIAGSSDLDSYFNLYKTGSAYNYGGYASAKYTQLTEDARVKDANDINKVFEEYKEAEEILLAQDTAVVPLYQSASNYLIRPEVKNVVFHLYGDYYNFRTAYVKGDSKNSD
ncbi:oligopeptide transport system substrate-binding protein [Pilibacter termitis]|uniref:Oligopeptide transport system substrate-binding protein n=1 Tax=Pilibacter termitis TaxID=263852 RepID=A0A1T4MH50_9ENTE|nr:peptide ABC transporter substrate-binding protein [Pilibacter termitis]SJZ66094.1 oligopeptide transport system substrate-binding protein [Pilibacter termitis]